jgi:predicted dehydrogenase
MRKKRQTLRWVVCGAGGLAGRKIVRDGLRASAHCELVAVQSVPGQSARAEGARYKVPAFTSVEEMLERVDCDAVYIATPQFLHLEQVRVAARRGKHILCEKPLAVTVADAEQIVKLCRQARIFLGTDFNYRYHPLHQKMRALIRSGAIGHVVSGRCQFGQDFPPKPGAFRQISHKAGGGAFADTGNHAVDLLEYIMGRRVVAVAGLKRRVIYSYETEDCAAALLEFAEGGVGLVDAYFCCPINTLRNDIEINGTRGTMCTRDTLQMETRGTLVVRGLRRTAIEKCPAGVDMYKRVFDEFSAAVLAGKPPPMTGADGLHSQRIIEAVYASSKTGRTVAIDK